MAICQSCNKFASYDESHEPELDSMEEPDIESEQIIGNIRVCLASECCGDEMKEYNFEVEHDIASEVAAFRKEHKLSDDIPIEGELSLETEMTSRQETKDRNGKPIKNARYMKTFYGFSASGTMTLCAEKGKKQVETEIEIAFDDDVQASCFEELY